MMTEPTDEDDCYVTDNEVGTTSTSGSGPGYWPLLELDEMTVRQQPPVYDHPLSLKRLA